jgi:hypothetical protein
MIPKQKLIELNNIAEFVNIKLGIDVTKNKKRSFRDLVYARALFFVIARQTIKISHNALGNFLGKDHSTVLHALKIWDAFLSEDYQDHVDEYKIMLLEMEAAPDDSGVIIQEVYNNVELYALKKKLKALTLENLELIKAANNNKTILRNLKNKDLPRKKRQLNK